MAFKYDDIYLLEHVADVLRLAKGVLRARSSTPLPWTMVVWYSNGTSDYLSCINTLLSNDTSS